MTENKPWRLHFKDGRQDFKLTDDEAAKVHTFLGDRSERFYKYTDEDGAEYVFAKNDIKGMEKGNKKQTCTGNATFICDWGNEHYSDREGIRCGCWKKYGYHWTFLWSCIRKNDEWEHVYSNGQVTEEMRNVAARMYAEREIQKVDAPETFKDAIRDFCKTM